MAPLMRNALGVLLAGGQGERLWPLTRDRAKPAVPFGGVYRIIDVTLSNCLNSDLRRVFRPHAIQSAQPQSPRSARLVRTDGPGRFHRSTSATDARFAALVSRHR